MKIGLFGGTFDPPHHGHRLVAERALDSLDLDRLIWIPANRSPHKTGQAQTESRHRMAMARLTAQGDNRFEVSDVEMKRRPPSFMVDTLEQFRSDLPEAKLFLIVGEDSLAGFSSWRSPGRIQDLATLAVYPRKGTWPPPELKHPVAWIEAPIFEMSSTSIRARLREGLPIDHMVTESVRAYLLKHNLFPPDDEARVARG